MKFAAACCLMLGSMGLPIATDHTTWLFHQLGAIDKLAKKFK